MMPDPADPRDSADPVDPIDRTGPADPRDPDERAKAAARRLAANLATAEGAREARARQRAGALLLPEPGLQVPGGLPAPGAEADRSFVATAGAPVAARDTAVGWPRPISIWAPRGAGGELAFVRPAPNPLGDHFAARREIRPKRAPLPLRVCLFGESAAAGYLYAPHFTPAAVLEAQLRAAAGEGAAEVIDLARTNETLPSLVATLESAVQIQPDVLVLFAGNNWNLLETPEVSPYAPAVEARQAYAEAWRAAGPGGPRALAAERLRRTAEAAFARVAAVAAALRVPVVLIVPEVSLAGWENRQPLHWQAGAGAPRTHPMADWYRLLARARRALVRMSRMAAMPGIAALPRVQAAAAEIAAAAQAMQAIDGGGNPTSWRLLARAHAARGDAVAAARAARAEVDAAAYPLLAFLGAPQAGTLAQEVLRQAARRHGFACVDLPHLLAEHTGSPLPGRRLFLDYCHLTSEGIEVAMAATAAEVLHLSGIADGEPGWRDILRQGPRRPAPGVEALARLGAAVHGAHRLLAVGEKARLLDVWCDAALDASPSIAAAMLDLVAARAAPLPAVLTPAQGRLLASPHPLGLPHGWRWDHADAEVVAAILASLERRGALAEPAARAAACDAESERIAVHGLRPGGVGLIDPPYFLWEPLERFFPEAMELDDQPRPGLLRAPWPETSFCLICDGGSDAGLEITARLPLPPSPTPGEPYRGAPGRRPPALARRRGTLRLAVNGRPAGAVPLREGWSRAAVVLPRHLLRRGANRLTLHWPMPPASLGGLALDAALARLDEGIAADLHPVFGEVWSLAAR